MKKLKSQKGAITLVTLITMLFILAFTITTYVFMANKATTEIEITEEVRKKYNNLGDLDNIYNNYLGKDVLNIYTVDELLKIGSGDNIAINGKVYKFSDDKLYVLMNNLSFDANNYSTILNGQDWIAIGDTNYMFDGNGHKITVEKLDGTVVEYTNENQYKDINLEIND